MPCALAEACLQGLRRRGVAVGRVPGSRAGPGWPGSEL